MKTYATSIDYQNRGWAVFPLVPGGKIPATPDGFKSATTDHSAGEQWFKGTKYNIGIATGAVSGIVVLDIDRKSSGYSSLAELEKTHGSLPHTYRVRTGGLGAHYYFRHPGGTFRNKTGLRPGVDVRGDGGYVVAPPSVTDGPYELTHDLPLADMPPWLIEMCQEKPKKQVLVGNNQDVVEGGRNNYLTQVGGALQKRGLTIEALSAALHAENEARCHPPLPEWEVDTIIKSVSRYDADSPIVVHETQEFGARASTYISGMFSTLADKDKTEGKPTGIKELDAMLGGGKRLGELTVLMATAKTGKSSLYAFLIHSWLKQGVPVGYASREMKPEHEVLPHLLSVEFRENVLRRAIKYGIDSDRQKKYKEAVERWPLYFTRGYGKFPINNFRSWVNEMKAKGVSYFFVDHLHYCLSGVEDWAEAVELTQELKALANSEEVHIDLIVQPTKLPDGVKLGLNTLRGGAGIGQALDNLLLLEPEPSAKYIRKLTLERARWPLAEPGQIYLQYDPEVRDFTVVEPQDEHVPPPIRPRTFGQEFVLNAQAPYKS